MARKKTSFVFLDVSIVDDHAGKIIFEERRELEKQLYHHCIIGAQGFTRL